MVKALFKNIQKDDQRYTTYNMLITFHHSLTHQQYDELCQSDSSSFSNQFTCAILHPNLATLPQ